MTRREEIAELLKGQPMTVKQLAEYFGTTFLEIVEDLEHVKQSVKPPFKFSFEPAQCRTCGFLFKGREKLRRPSRCPKCKAEDITEARFVIEK